MRIQQLMKESYNDLALVPNFYYQWNVGIHVELGGEHYQLKENGKLNMMRFETAYRQVFCILPLLFQKTDDIIVVVQSFPNEAEHTTYPNFFQRYIREQNRKYTLLLRSFNWVDEEESIVVQQMELSCKAADIKLELLTKTLIHEDFYSLKPQLRKKHSMYAPDVFLVNVRTKCIFHLYDDRGCEIINKNQALHEELLHAIKSLNLFMEEEIQSKP